MRAQSLSKVVATAALVSVASISLVSCAQKEVTPAVQQTIEVNQPTPTPAPVTQTTTAIDQPIVVAPGPETIIIDDDALDREERIIERSTTEVVVSSEVVVP